MFSFTSPSLSAKGLLTPREHPAKVEIRKKEKTKTRRKVKDEAFIPFSYSRIHLLRNTNFLQRFENYLCEIWAKRAIDPLSGSDFFQGLVASGNHFTRVIEEIGGGQCIVQKLMRHQIGRLFLLVLEFG